MSRLFNNTIALNYKLSFIGDNTGTGQLKMPIGIAVDAEDRIYVADQMNLRVQVFQYLSEKWKAAQQRNKHATGR